MIVISWLAYLTKQNFHDRQQNVVASMKSLQGFSHKDLELVIVDNSELDNFETVKLRDKYLPNVEVFKAANEFCDVAAHLTAYSMSFNSDLFGYTYDDFIFYKHDWISDIINFMSHEPEVSCCRIPKFDGKSLGYFDADVTAKTKNPEATRLSNTYRNQSFFIKTSDFSTQEHTFYKTILRPISRPTIWKPSHFDKFVPEKGDIKTLQQFEKHLYDVCDAQDFWRSALLNLGVCHTFPQVTSERIKQGLGIQNKSPVFDIDKFEEAFEDEKRWL